MVKARNAGYTKEYNRKLIINLLMKEPMSRSELARRTGLTRSAMTIITDEMLAEGLITETKRLVKNQGRTPIPLDVNKDAYFAAGVYLNRERCAVGLVNLKNECIKEKELDISHCGDAESAMDIIGQAVREVLKEIRQNNERFLGVGVSAPGPINRETGRILNPPDFQLWQYVDFGKGISARTGCAVYVDNDAYALADYSRRFVDSEISSYLFLKIGPRVGSGIINKGRLYRGVDGLSGEIGHISIDLNGRRCSCGNYGCLEIYASFPNLLKEFGGKYPTWERVIAQAGANDNIAMEILRKEADYLSAGIVSALNAINLEAVVFAGDILSGFDIIAPMMEERINGRIITRSFRNIRLLSARTGMNEDIPASANIVFSLFFTV